jgi:formylglycine-generating enzyme required for sulfatase activity
MVKCEVVFPTPLPDDPHKWDGWSKYKSSNPYERLCLDSQQNPTNELIEEHCRELLRWWQKKLPLKNQPSNPVAQLLRAGLDESSKYLTEARIELLDPERRKKVDEVLAAEKEQQAIAEFNKFFAFSTADGGLRPEEEKALISFGADHGLSEEKILQFIEEKLKETGVRRFVPEPEVKTETAVAVAPADTKSEFLRVLQLSGLDSESMTDDQRDALINIAENSGLDPGDAEDMVDDYLEEIDRKQIAAITKGRPKGPAPLARNGNTSVKVAPKVATKAAAKVEVVAEASPVVMARVLALSPEQERKRYPNYTNSLGGQMFLVPSGELIMGNPFPGAPPNETPHFRVTITRFYMSRFPITNAHYEAFDPSHKSKRAPATGDRHPVVYVSSLEAMKFCQWLSMRERKKYRLPTEAEWEYAAKGTDGRKYPWGNFDKRGDLANFADKNTSFAWSDSQVDDGYPESSPVGSFPRGASPFGIEDMAGNVWEWCGDFFEAYKSTSKTDPRGPTNGTKRVYRGGSWKSRFASLRTTARSANLPNFSCNDLGFRIVCECE